MYQVDFYLIHTSSMSSVQFTVNSVHREDLVDFFRKSSSTVSSPFFSHGMYTVGDFIRGFLSQDQLNDYLDFTEQHSPNDIYFNVLRTELY